VGGKHVFLGTIGLWGEKWGGEIQKILKANQKPFFLKEYTWKLYPGMWEI
jgi:hypothetical protein